MPKVTRPRLARGTKLVLEHQTGATQPMANLVNTAGFDTDNLVNNRGVCRVNVHVPVVDGIFWKYSETAGQGNDFMIPFTLPPLQEFFNSSGTPSADLPAITLDEFTISFDQAAEAAGIVAPGGNLSYIGVVNYDIAISLVEKPQKYFSADNGYTPEREVFSCFIPNAAFAGATYRVNPFVLTQMGKAMSPYKTYALIISAPGLYDSVNSISYTLPSLTFSLKLLHPLVPRDMGAQNMPLGLDNQVPNTITLHAPLPNQVINADGTYGTQTALNLLDQALLNRLDGGVTWDSNKPVFEAVATESTYDIIMVPMWQNIPQGELGWTAGNMEYQVGIDWFARIPYCGSHADGYNQPTCDRRFVPLPFPVAIHHVIAVANYGHPGGPGHSGEVPVSHTLHNRVGVGIGTALRSDFISTAQVAYVEWAFLDKDTYRIDQLKARPQGTLTTDAYDFELFSVPLVGSGGTGYYPQGKPVFCGMSNSATHVRTNLGAGTPDTIGLEQYLEVRWQIYDPSGLGNAFSGGAAASDDTCYVGYGGNWVQIVGKKSAVQAVGDIPRV